MATLQNIDDLFQETNRLPQVKGRAELRKEIRQQSLFATMRPEPRSTSDQRTFDLMYAQSSQKLKKLTERLSSTERRGPTIKNFKPGW